MEDLVKDKMEAIMLLGGAIAIAGLAYGIWALTKGPYLPPRT